MTAIKWAFETVAMAVGFYVALWLIACFIHWEWVTFAPPPGRFVFVICLAFFAFANANRAGAA